MLKKIAFILLTFISINSYGWGIIGHRAIGAIAQEYLSRKASKKIARVLKGENMAIASTWMDEIRSDEAYDHMETWHWVTIPDGMTYDQSEKAETGDALEAIERMVNKLKQGNLSEQEEAEALKILIHLVGDIHQPLHVGTGEDAGGNQVKIKWFWQSSNLHRVWDSEMIDDKKYSYTELAAAIDYTNKIQVTAWQNSTIRDWTKEAMTLRGQVYDIPEDENLKYEYLYKNWDTVKQQLLKAGVRLAGLLNEIYG
ncbi:MAG: S1/P1 nuclease [Fulvivirga sp.]